MNANEFQTLEEYIKDFDDSGSINISFNGCDWFRFKVKNVKTKRKYALMRTFLVVGINKKFITVMTRKKVENAVV